LAPGFAFVNSFLDSFKGLIEDGEEIGKLTHTTKALFVVSTADAHSLAVLNPYFLFQ
jgi:hypothetical protein